MSKIKSIIEFRDDIFIFDPSEEKHPTLWLYSFAEQYADYVLKAKLESITDSKKGQKAKLRERYFIETGIYPLDNLNRYNHWLEDEICEVKEWIKQKLIKQ